MPSSSRRWLVVACATGMLLAACDDAPSEGAAAGQAAPLPAKPTATVLPPDMVMAASSTRNANVVGVHFVLGGIPTLNQALPVDIAIVPHEPMTTLGAHFSGPADLAVATGNELEARSDPAPEKVVKHQLVLLPLKEGVFMVTVIVDTGDSEGSVSRVFSIPVIVGPPTAAAPAKPAGG